MRCEPIDAPQNFSEMAARPMPGKRYCQLCGCTDDRACPDGCYWVSTDPPICSACAPPQTAEELESESGFYGAERCPASEVPALHIPIYVDQTSGYCVRCRQGFVT